MKNVETALKQARRRSTAFSSQTHATRALA